MTVKQVISDYKSLLIEEGMTSKEELIEMLKLEDDLAPKYKTEEHLNEIAESILAKTEIKKGSMKRTEIREEKKEKSYEKIKRERLELYNQGLTDRQIADELNDSKDAIRAWRRREGLKANKQAKPKEESLKDRRIRLFNEGLKHREIAELECVTLRTIQTWFFNNGIKRYKEREKECLLKSNEKK